MYPSYYKKGNWGRWGEDDERGALNILTTEIVKKASRLVKKGKTYTLGLPIMHNAGNGPTFPGRVPPVHVALYSRGGPKGSGGGDDYLVLNSHNAPSHIDALGHFWRANRLYNNISDDVVSAAGAARCGIDKVGAIVTRGVLLDMARYKGVNHLESGEIVSGTDMIDCAKSEGIEFEPGDAVLLRTGYLNTFDPKMGPAYFDGCPGFGLSTAKVFDSNGTVALGADTAYVEVHPSEVKDEVVPLHEELLWRRGLYFLELLDLEGLAKDRVYEFLLIVNPLKIQGGLGSPINPVAIA